ncbi:MAG: hypothetical protein H6608_04840 [Flavobacteriales bacterium]|nr:hypothetical protein [Flavobacteriales bacterium]
MIRNQATATAVILSTRLIIFGERRGDFTVCLSIQTNQGCTDKYCLPLFNQYGRELEMFNVLRPEIPMANDEFTIVLGGEEFHKLRFLIDGVNVFSQ